MSAVSMEIRKLKRRHFWLMSAALGGLALVWSAGMLAARAAGDPELRLLSLSLADSINMTTMLLPLIAALLASRLATVDSEERMDQLLTSLSQRERARFGGKLVLGTLAVSAGQLTIVGFAVLVGPGMGLRTTPMDRSLIWSIAVVIIAASLAAMAVQLVLSMCVPKQAIGLSVGALASLVCIALPFMHLGIIDWLLPWGIAGGASPLSQASYQAGTVILVAHPWLNALCAVLAAAFWTLLAGLSISYRESHR